MPISPTSALNNNDDNVIEIERPMGVMPQQPIPFTSSARQVARDDDFLADPPDTRSYGQSEPLSEDLNPTRLVRILAYFGLGRMAMQSRKSYVSLLLAIVWSVVQVHSAGKLQNVAF